MASINNRVVHGARCVILVNSVPVGLFTSVSYGVNYSHQPIYILGRLSAAEIAMTGMDVITVQAHGWRVFGHGPFQSASGSSSGGSSNGSGPGPTGGLPANGEATSGEISMVQLQNLFSAPDTAISIMDRTGGADGKGAVIMNVTGAKIVAMQSQVNSRQAQDFSVTFVGLAYSDEAGTQAEPGIGLPA